jgi:hypothetical protein
MFSMESQGRLYDTSRGLHTAPVTNQSLDNLLLHLASPAEVENGDADELVLDRYSSIEHAEPNLAVPPLHLGDLRQVLLMTEVAHAR